MRLAWFQVSDQVNQKAYEKPRLHLYERHGLDMGMLCGEAANQIRSDMNNTKFKAGRPLDMLQDGGAWSAISGTVQANIWLGITRNSQQAVYDAINQALLPTVEEIRA